MPDLGLLQPLPGDFQTNDVTSGSIPVNWSHVMSLPVTWLPPPASYSFVRSEMYSIRQFSAFYSHFQVTSQQMTSLPGHFRSPEVTSCHFLSREASSCKLQPCRKWNVQHTPVFGLLQPLPVDFWSNDVTSGSLLETWGHVTSFPVTWLPPSALYSLVGSEMHSIRQFEAFYSHFEVTSGQMTPLPGHFRSPEVTWCHFLSRDCLLRASACRKRNVQYAPVFHLLHPLPGDFRSNDITFGSLPVTWGHVSHLLSRDCLLLRATAL